MTSTEQKPGFYITKGKGFQITFENGWTASVQFGPGNYCDNYHEPLCEETRRRSGERGSGTAEIAAWDADDNWHDFGSSAVGGHVSPADVLAFLNEIAAKAPA